MKNFDKIIKEKVDGFEVPFNETHWAEMEAKLNTVHSKKKKTLLFGSAAVAITLAISAYFLFPTNSTINSDTNKQVTKEELPINIEPAKEEVTITNNKTEVIKTRNTSLATKPTNLVTAVEPEETLTKNSVKTRDVITPTIIAEKNETIVSEKIEVEESSIRKTKLPLKKVETTPAKEITNNPKIKTEESVVSTDRRKSVRHKVYEDEHVSKKSIKRKRGNIFRFFSFKKRLYKVPLSKKKSKKK